MTIETRVETTNQASNDELLQFAQFEVDRVTNLLYAATSKKSPAEIKGFKKLLDKAQKRLDLLSTETQLSGGNLETLRMNVDRVAEEARGEMGMAVDFDAAQADSEAYDELKIFLEQNREGNFRQRADFKKWNQEKEAQKAHVDADEELVHARERKIAEDKTREIYTMAAMDIREKNGFPPLPEELEKQREWCIQEVMREGGFKIVTSLHKEESPKGSGGFQTVFSDRVVERGDELAASKEILGSIYEKDSRGAGYLSADEVLKKHKRSEVVGFKRATQPLYQTTPAKKGFMGIGAEPEKRVKVGDKPQLHSELVTNGQSEPAVYLAYSAADTAAIPLDDQWTDYSGRRGQIMTLEVVLPESVAKSLQDRLAQDPALIRQIVKRAFKEKLLAEKPDRWEKPPESAQSSKKDSLSPPYDRWDRAEGGGKIYVQPLDAAPGWHDENDRKITAK